MFSIYWNSTLIGRSALESGDPPMGVAFGKFLPTSEFAAMRNQMVEDGPNLRRLTGLSAAAADGIRIDCAAVTVTETANADDPSSLEVECLGIEFPKYGDLFPEQLRKYEEH